MNSLTSSTQLLRTNPWSLPTSSRPPVSAAPADLYERSDSPSPEVNFRDILKLSTGQPTVSPEQQASLGRAVAMMGGLGLTPSDRESLLSAHPREPHLQALLEKDKPYTLKPSSAEQPANSPSEVKDGILKRMGQYLRAECQKMGEKCLKTADSLAKAAKEFEVSPKLAKLSPLLGTLGQGLSVLANSLRGASDQQDPKQMAADFAKAVKDMLKLLEKTSLKGLAKTGTKLLPGLGEAVIGWDIYSAGKKSQEANKKGDKAAATAWAVVAGLNTLAFSMRGTCDLAAAITALTVGGASPGTAPVMAGTEAAVGLLCGVSEMVAMALD